ncbi:MAG: peroxiredoxin [Myxococcota bacterium]|nr:peroxiredoxin [Myxococcota bacterium]
MRTLMMVTALALSACGATQSGSGGLLSEGDPAPDFVAQDQDGEIRQLRAIRGDRPVVLFFYPRDGTPGCTAEACAFRDAWDRIEATGATVVGVSTDDVAAHRAFAEEHGLQFTLLADPEGEILEKYRVPSRMGMAARLTYLIDGEGRVARVFPDVDPAVHVDEVLAAIAALE